MKAQLRIVTGSRTGVTQVFSQDRITIGRHPDSALQLDPHHDLDVSTRHATIERQGDRWIVRDQGSRNGTYVNGHKIAADTRLDDTDQIRLGSDGPLIEFRTVPDKTPDTTPTPISPRQPRATGASGSPAPVAAKAKASTTQRVHVEVARQTRRHRHVTGVLAVLLLGVAVSFWFVSRQQRLARERQVAELQAQIDSVLQDAGKTVDLLRGQMAELASTLRSSQQDVQALQQGLTAAREAGNRESVENLSAQLESALSQLADQQLAARIDFEGIAAANQRAVALVFVEFGPGQVETGTAFAVRSDGTMLTSRHVVAGADGNRTPRRIGVKFADSRQFFPAHLVALSQDDEVDLAVIRVNLRGQVPTILGLNRQPDTVPVGAAVAVIGFPGGVDSPQLETTEGTFATTTLTAGTVSKNLPNLIQINGYGAQGASGSPIFDASGLVIAILYGGVTASGGRIVYAVPSSYATRLLDSTG